MKGTDQKKLNGNSLNDFQRLLGDISNLWIIIVVQSDELNNLFITLKGTMT